MVYCQSLTWLSPLGKPRLLRQFVLSVCCVSADIIASQYSDDESDQSDITDIDKKIYILKTYKLKKQKQKHLIWTKKYLKK